MMAGPVTVCRLPPVLLGDASGDVQESHELAGDADLSSRSAYIGEGQRPHPEARAPVLNISKLTNSIKRLVKCAVVTLSEHVS